MVKVDRYEGFPEGLTDIGPREIRSVLPRPSFLRIKGGNADLAPLFLSTLLHGNETTSFFVLRELAKRAAAGEVFRRDIVIFVGNVWAAEKGVRVLPEQNDFNRIWRKGSSEEHRMAQEVLKYAREVKPFASIDIHNNAGTNPYYACFNIIRPDFLHLANLFSDTMVYFTNPSNVQSMAFAQICPAVTLECGLSGDQTGSDLCLNYILQVLEMDELSSPPPGRDFKVYHTAARIAVPSGSEISFLGPSSKADFSFTADVENLNFKHLKTPYDLGWYHGASRLLVTGANGEPLDHGPLNYHDGRIVLQGDYVPSMFTTDIDVVKQDCLGYLMELLDWKSLVGTQ